jgi:integrase
MMEEPSLTGTSSNEPSAESIVCPECGSKRLYKDGLRPLPDDSSVQRWLCRDCGLRFSEKKPLQENSHWHINTAGHSTSGRQVCAELLTRSAKNLATVETRQEKAQREGTRCLPGTLVDYAWKMKKRGLAEETIKQRIYRLNVLIRKGADLQNPDTVETILATEPWTPANKRFFVMAYVSFTKTYSIPWVPIRVRCESKQPFIPLESEIDQLIAGSGKRTATFLQVLKDTGARCGEIKCLRWTDVDDPKRAIRINDPEKGSNSRTVQVTQKTLAMLNALQKRSIYIFSPFGSEQPPKIRSLQSVFSRQRNKLAVRLQNPRLKQVHFHTLRHWKATTEYAKTRDILRVKYLLGHKRLENTEIYTHLVDFAADDYTVRRPKTSKEEDEFIEAGFEYVRYDEKEGCPIYRKRK